MFSGPPCIRIKRRMKILKDILIKFSSKKLPVAGRGAPVRCGRVPQRRHGPVQHREIQHGHGPVE